MGSYVRLACALPITIATGAVFACSSAYEEGPPSATPTTNDGGGDPDSSSTSQDSGATDQIPTWLPKAGTYRYRVDGQQYLSVGQQEYRDEGPVAPAEIRYEDGSSSCWRFRLCLVSGKCDDAPPEAYSENSWSFCVDNGRLEERSAREVTRWMLFNGYWQLAVSQLTCDPGQALYATTDLSMTSWGHVCTGKVDNNFTFASTGPFRYLGEDSVTIANKPVRAHHYAEERTVSANSAGAPAGKQIAEWWLAPNGLPLRVRRGVNIVTDLGFGVVYFRETTKTPYDAGTADGGGGQTMNDCVIDSLEPGPLPTVDAGDGG